MRSVPDGKGTSDSPNESACDVAGVSFQREEDYAQHIKYDGPYQRRKPADMNGILLSSVVAGAL